MQGLSIRHSGAGLLAQLGILRETGGGDGEGQAPGNLGMASGEVPRFEEAITAHQDAAAGGSQP